MKYFVVVPTNPGSKLFIILESSPNRAQAREAAKRRRENASAGSIHRLCRVLGRK